MKRLAHTLFSVSLLVGTADVARAGDRITLQLATGVDYARGDFGGTKTF